MKRIYIVILFLSLNIILYSQENNIVTTITKIQNDSLKNVLYFTKYTNDSLLFILDTLFLTKKKHLTGKIVLNKNRYFCFYYHEKLDTIQILDRNTGLMKVVVKTINSRKECGTWEYSENDIIRFQFDNNKIINFYVVEENDYIYYIKQN